MPVNQNAADSWARNTTGSKWFQGVQGGNIEAGLAAAGVANVEGSGLQQKWETAVSESEDKYSNNTGQDAASKWESAMSDASGWNI